jgi:hypothetical protein
MLALKRYVMIQLMVNEGYGSTMGHFITIFL